MYGQYNPQLAMGSMPNMQNRLNNYPYIQQPISPPNYPSMPAMPLNGRVVASVEEAKVAQVPMDGSAIYFPCPQEGKIFVKSMDLNGMAVFATYSLVNDVQAKPNYANGDEVAALRLRVDELEKMIKGVGNNESNAINNAV